MPPTTRCARGRREDTVDAIRCASALSSPSPRERERVAERVAPRERKRTRSRVGRHPRAMFAARPPPRPAPLGRPSPPLAALAGGGRAPLQEFVYPATTV